MSSFASTIVEFKGNTLTLVHGPREPQRTMQLMVDEIYQETYVSERCRVRYDDVVIDGGAHIGMFTLYALLNGARLVVAIEPNTNVIPFLHQNVENYGFTDKVVFVHDALYSEVRGRRQRMHFYANKHSVSARLVTEGAPYTHHVKTTTIDTIAQRLSTKIDFIKLDVEGSEHATLSGGVETIKRDKPDMSIALYHHPEFLDKFTVTSFIDSLGLNYSMEASGLTVKTCYNMIGLWSCAESL